VAEADVEDRLGFIRKVLGIITVQLIITALVTLIPLRNDSARVWILKNTWLLWTSFAVALLTELPLLCFREVARKVPLNYVLLITFTLAESYMVAFICAVYDPMVVAIAASLTAFATLALTAYALHTSVDFTFAAGSLYLFSAALFGCTFLALFLPSSQILRIVISGVSVIVFGLYLIFDIEMIVGGHYCEFGIDDYVIAAMQVYLDIIMLFLHILRLIGDRK
jgi:protein lifeguard